MENMKISYTGIVITIQSRIPCTIIHVCNCYIVLFLVEASSKRFKYHYPYQTCYICHLLNSLGSIHPLTRLKAPQVIKV